MKRKTPMEIPKILIFLPKNLLAHNRMIPRLVRWAIALKGNLRSTLFCIWASQFLYLLVLKRKSKKKVKGCKLHVAPYRLPDVFRSIWACLITTGTPRQQRDNKRASQQKREASVSITFKKKILCDCECVIFCFHSSAFQTFYYWENLQYLFLTRYYTL